MIAGLTYSTSGAGFKWNGAAPVRGLVKKFGICSWQLQQTGTWSGNKGQLRDLRNIFNRAFVQNGFHAAVWRDDTPTPVIVSQDGYGALLEVDLSNPASIAVYSPAAGASCT